MGIDPIERLLRLFYRVFSINILSIKIEDNYNENNHL